MIFKVLIQNLDETLEWEPPYKSFNFSEELNKDKTLNVSFDLAVLNDWGENRANVFESEYREIKLVDADGNNIHFGFVDELKPSGAKDGRGTYSLASKGFFSLLSKRYTSAEDIYTSEDSSDIAWGLIDYTQSLIDGDLGITRGANPTTKTRTRTFRYKKISEAIEGMTADKTKEGFEFDIDNEKKFNIYYPFKGSQKDAIIFERGYNVETYQITRPGLLSLANQVLVFGEGNGADSEVVTRDAETVYKEKFFLLQETLSEKDVSETDTLEDKGDKFLEERKYPREVIDITCQYDRSNYHSFGLGDSVKLIIPEENINNFYRVRKRGLKDDGTVNLTLYSL